MGAEFASASVLLKANNLSDVLNASTARSNLGLEGQYRPQDHGFIAWSNDPSLATNSTILPTAGTVFCTRLKLAAAASITNVIINLSVAGATLTANQCIAGLYQGGTLIGSTADQSTPWSSSGLKIMALTGGPFAVTAGDVIVALFYNGTTAPTPSRAGSSVFVNGNLAAASSRFATADTGRTTTLASPLGALTAISIAYWAAVS